MRLGIVCYPTIGGSGVLATELGLALATKGHEVHFITYEQPFRLPSNHENIFFHAVDTVEYELFRYPDYALPLAVKMAEVSQHHQLDVLHVHYAIPHATSAYLAKQLMGDSCPAVVTTLHGTDITLVGRDPAYFQLVKFSIEQSDGVTAVSQSLKKQTQHHFNISRPIEVIYNFTTPHSENFDTIPLRRELAPQGEKLIIHSSNFRPVKRVEDVVRIFHKVRQRIPSKLLLIGSGSSLDTVRLLVEELKLENDVIFMGSSIKIDNYLMVSDLFLLPSAEESFGLVALEAMSYGVPVIASEVGGLPEVIQHGKTGYLAPMGDVATMGNYAVDILSDPALAAKIGEAARQRALTEFSAETIVPQYEALYYRHLSKNE